MYGFIHSTKTPRAYARGEVVVKSGLRDKPNKPNKKLNKLYIIG